VLGKFREQKKKKSYAENVVAVRLKKLQSSKEEEKSWKKSQLWVEKGWNL